jgi:hypothetical protein
MRQILACCGILGLLFSSGSAWKAANTEAANVSISGSGMEMAAHVPGWVYWPANARIDAAKIDQNAATGEYSGIVQATLTGDLPAAEGDFVRGLSASGFTVRKVTLPEDTLFGAFSVLEAVDARRHRRINIVLRDQPWAESVRIFFIEEPATASAKTSA